MLATRNRSSESRKSKKRRSVGASLTYRDLSDPCEVVWDSEKSVVRVCLAAHTQHEIGNEIAEPLLEDGRADFLAE